MRFVASPREVLGGMWAGLVAALWPREEAALETGRVFAPAEPVEEEEVTFSYWSYWSPPSGPCGDEYVYGVRFRAEPDSGA
jgi:hypothetical protein